MFRTKGLWILFCMSILMFGMTESVSAAEFQEKAAIEVEGFQKPSSLYDNNRNTYSQCAEQGNITITNIEGIKALYIEFDRLPEEWTLTNPDSGVSVTCGTNAFLHEFVDVKSLFDTVPTRLVLTFAANTTVADVYSFSNEQDIPEWVQIWEPPCEEADLLLISSHSDDEQLFFAGILPYYAGEKNLQVQVAYVVQHFEVNGSKNHQRPHEQLDGLWTVGVRNYPVMSDFPDLYAESKDRNVAFQQAESVFASAGVTYDDFISYMTECIRRFKPLVVVSHDLNGEYGHGTHVLAASALTEAITYATDETKYTESASKYGTWNIEKLYLHLYEENQIQMNWDIPLESFGGKTAFEVTQEGFGCHKSQHWTWFYKWIYGTPESPRTKATDIPNYSPCKFGLYYTNVGNDVTGGDFFENVKTYEQRYIEEQERLEQERLEQERLEQERLEQERLEQERLEQERLEQERLEQERLEEKIRKENTMKLVIAAIVVILIAGVAIVVLRRNKRG